MLKDLKENVNKEKWKILKKKRNFQNRKYTI